MSLPGICTFLFGGSITNAGLVQADRDGPGIAFQTRGAIVAGASASPSSPFQAADCASLGFKPSLSIQLLGGTTRTATPRLKAVVKARAGDANIARAQVTLPPSEFLEQAHIRTVCTRVQFNAGAGNGAQCPKASVYGKAKAISPLLDEPLSGPVFLRSSDNELPDMVAALHSAKVDIDLVGRIDSTRQGGIRSTFEGVPDAPVSKFVLEMQGGKKGLIVNSEDICKAKHRAKAAFKGQNGKRHEFNRLHPRPQRRPHVRHLPRGDYMVLFPTVGINAQVCGCIHLAIVICRQI